MSKNTRSIRLSYLLRHNPQQCSLTLDKEGWCSVDQLVQNTDYTVDELRNIVNTDGKMRYSLNTVNGQLFIRANQGHSTDVKLSFKTQIPPVVLYHGTTESAYQSIMKQGLLPGSRHHVHLSHDLNTATLVAGRRKGTIILTIDTRAMVNNGIKFYISDNGVWLVDQVPSQYIGKV